MATLNDLNRLLDAVERSSGSCFVGTRVSDAIRNATYPIWWRSCIERYIKLIGEEGCDEKLCVANLSLYCDLACTVITKKIMMVDIFYMYDPPVPEPVETTRLREIHMVVAKKYLAKMITCIYECVCGQIPVVSDMERAATILYAHIYSEAFDVASVDEKEVFQLVQKWFCASLLPPDIKVVPPHNVAPGIPFLSCGHVYWLWLHLTAARVQYSTQALRTVIYALDMIVYCEECKRHFLKHRKEFFFDNADGCLAKHDNPELLFHLHNRVNVQTAATPKDISILLEYKGFWEKT